MSVRVDDHGAAQGTLKRGHNALIFTHAALEDHRRNDFLPLAHVIEVVCGHGVADSGNDILFRMPHLDFMDQIGLCKDRTARGNLGWMAGPQGIVADFLHLDAQPFRLTGKKRAGPRGTEGIHGIVHRHAVFDKNDFGILPADFKDGPHIGIKGSSSHGMGGDFILDHSRAKDGPHQFSRASGGSCGRDLVTALVELPLQKPHQLLDGPNRISLGPDILTAENPVVLIDNYAFGRDRTHVDAQKSLFHIKAPSFSYRSYHRTPPAGFAGPRRWSGRRRSGRGREFYNLC